MIVIVFSYLIKLTIALSVVYGFYTLLLKRLTFHKWNRLYLLCYPLVCFIFPLINLDPILQNDPERVPELLNGIPTVNDYIPSESNLFGEASTIVFVCLAAGSAFYLAKLFIQYLSFRKIKKNAVLLHDAGSIRIYSSAEGSFTLGNDIYIDTSAEHSQDELERVLQHEMIHVKQKHWIDLVAGELLCVVNWFNPFAWKLRAAIRQNLEYIADQKVLEKGYDTKAYQYLLLKVSGISICRIAAHFSINDLKKRINMMNKIKSAHVHLVKFVFILPLVAFMLLAFRTVQQAPLMGMISSPLDTVPESDSLEIGIISADTVVVHGKNFKKDLIYTGGQEVIIIHNNKTKEVIAMTMKEWNKDKKNNERKYGKLPRPPKPPVPPVPPVPPAPPTPLVAPEPVVSPQPAAPPQPAPPPEPGEAPVAPVAPAAPVKN